MSTKIQKKYIKNADQKEKLCLDLKCPTDINIIIMTLLKKMKKIYNFLISSFVIILFSQ